MAKDKEVAKLNGGEVSRPKKEDSNKVDVVQRERHHTEIYEPFRTIISDSEITTFVNEKSSSKKR